MRRLFFALALLAGAISGCAPAGGNQPGSAPVTGEEPEVTPLPDLGAAPELVNDTWLNTGEPLRLADLRGKVVLLDMWTFG
ncbi:MAG: hypothetical protein EHM70_25605 [Chloroflexota bacterium]|nr:MAG: hypothetical protein EHM70_25605 [Chloroflexota bacterium]